MTLYSPLATRDQHSAAGGAADDARLNSTTNRRGWSLRSLCIGAASDGDCARDDNQCSLHTPIVGNNATESEPHLAVARVAFANTGPRQGSARPAHTRVAATQNGDHASARCEAADDQQDCAALV